MAAVADLLGATMDSRPRVLVEDDHRPAEVAFAVAVVDDHGDATRRREISPPSTNASTRSVKSASPPARGSYVVNLLPSRAHSIPMPEQLQQRPGSSDSSQVLISSVENTRPESMGVTTSNDGGQNGARPSVEAKRSKLEELDDDEEGGLSPPPDSLPDDDDGSAANLNGHVVAAEPTTDAGVKATGRAQSTAPDQEDAEMEEAEADATAPRRASISASAYPKRKRTSVYETFAEDKLGNQSVDPPDDGPIELELRQRAPKPSKAPSGVKGVVLGIWRDSQVPEMQGRHSVIGFIDVRDRLRTRIQPYDRDGNSLTGSYPLPPGPGGSWVTFDKVAFEPHLVGLNHFQIKEYVKIRAETARPDEEAEEKKANDQAAVAEALERVDKNTSAESSIAPAIAYGPELPDNVHLPARPEKKRRLLGGSNLGNSPVVTSATAAANVLESIAGTRPTRVLVGVWKASSEDQRERKHAVYGILGANDMFRVKLVRETRDGTQVIGNFPNGAGALWIHWDEVDFDQHLSSLTRPEVKEYCRVRQRQIDVGELPSQRAANEAQAVYQAQQRVRQMTSSNVNIVPSNAPKRRDSDFATTPAPNDPSNSSLYQQQQSQQQQQQLRPPFLAAAGSGYGLQLPMPDGLPSQPHLRSSEAALRQQKKDAANDGGMANRPQLLGSLAEAGAHRPTRHSLPSMDMERANSIARREIQKVEQAQIRADQRAASREAAATAAMTGGGGGGGVGAPHDRRLPGLPPISSISGPDANGNMDNKTIFQDNVARLNKIWAAQEANRLRNGAEDAKISNGIKYERKLMGPFSGKLVSQGTILNIDGEDYVEYRVLTKPSFF